MAVNFEKFVEKFAVSNAAAVDALLAVVNTALVSAERITALNVNAARGAVEDTAAATRTLLGATDAQAAIAAQQALVQPAVEKTVSYAKSLYEISNEAQQELSSLLESQIASYQTDIACFLEEAAHAAPAGSESVVAAMKEAIAQANAAFANASAMSKQFAEATQATLATGTKAVAVTKAGK